MLYCIWSADQHAILFYFLLSNAANSLLGGYFQFAKENQASLIPVILSLSGIDIYYLVRPLI